ncbi:uncharacterized protein LOC144118837 isoform X1 [Amblyomma americanum]
MRRNDSYLEYAANLDRGKIKKLPLIRGDPADEATKLIMKTVVKTPVAHMYTLKGRGEKEAFKNLRLYCEIVAQNTNSQHGSQQQSGCVRAGGERLGWRSESSGEGGGHFTPVIGALYARMPKMSCKNK